MSVILCTAQKVRVNMQMALQKRGSSGARVEHKQPLTLLVALLLRAQGRQLPRADALALLRSSSRSALWRYLRHLVSLPADDGELHTELAIVLVDEALDLLSPGEPAAVDSVQNGITHAKSFASGVPRDLSGDAQRTLSEPVLVASGSSSRGGVSELALVRRQLQEHLAASDSYDVDALLGRLAGTQLWEERVVVHAKARLKERVLTSSQESDPSHLPHVAAQQVRC